MKEILDKHGEAIWRKLGDGLTADRLGTVWKDPQGDFRIDAGSAVLPEGKLKT
jgi:hypothetical protein